MKNYEDLKEKISSLAEKNVVCKKALDDELFINNILDNIENDKYAIPKAIVEFGYDTLGKIQPSFKYNDESVQSKYENACKLAVVIKDCDLQITTKYCNKDEQILDYCHALGVSYNMAEHIRNEMNPTNSMKEKGNFGLLYQKHNKDIERD